MSDMIPYQPGATDGVSWKNYSGTLRMGETLSYGFKATFAKPVAWLLIGTLGTILLFVGSLSAAMILFSILEGDELSTTALLVCGILVVISGLPYPLVTKLALNQMDTGLLQFKAAVSNLRVWGAAGVYVVVSAMFMAVLLAVVDPEVDSQFAELLIYLLTAAAFIVTPFIQNICFYLVDTNRSLGSCLSESFAVGKRNYFQLIVLNVLINLLLQAGLSMLIFGAVVAVPVGILAYAHAYQQISRGYLPGR